MLGSDNVSQTAVTSTLLEGDIACSNQIVIFTCTASGFIIWWGSEDYIGTNHHLEIPSSRAPGYSIPSPFNEDTVATLHDYDPITEVLTSQLRITALVTLSPSTITCGNTDTGETVTINFTVTGRSRQNFMMLGLIHNYINASPCIMLRRGQDSRKYSVSSVGCVTRCTNMMQGNAS